MKSSLKLVTATLTCAGLLATYGCSQEAAAPEMPCGVDRDSDDFEEQETRCDGLDNDCDGLTDELLPAGATACATGAKGACGAGFYACQGGERVCLAPPAVAEAKDGVDNDCDGQTDEPGDTATLPARARVAVPPYMWAEGTQGFRLFRTLLETIGLPFDAPEATEETAEAQWDQLFLKLDDYRLILMPGYLNPTFLDEDKLDALEAWLDKGGVLIWTKVLGPNETAIEPLQPRWQRVGELAGITARDKELGAERVRLTGVGPATLWLDDPVERELHVAHDGSDITQQLEMFTFSPTEGTEVLAEAVGANGVLGPVWLRRAHGKGAVYTLGYDPTNYSRFRCYVNCFDVGMDAGVMLFKGAWREASKGHYVVKHTVPGTEPGVFLPSHDIDAPDADNAGEWGLPGAVQMAEMEQVEGVAGTYFITTDYVRAYYNPAMVKRLCQLGMCPAGGHSVQHLLWGKFPLGDCGSVRRDTYKTSAPTLCGEVVVNLEILSADVPAGTRLDGWRTPYLNPNPHQYTVLHSQGVRFDSSLAVGDLRTNFPVDLPRFAHFHLEDLSDLDEMWVMPMALEDGIGTQTEDGFTRRELTEKWWPEFRARWQRQIRGNAANGAWSVQLVHPSMGVGDGVTPDNVAFKVEAVRWAIREAKKLGLRMETIGELGDFWRARQAARLVDVTYADGVYTGRVVVGKWPMRRLSLEFGDTIARFEQNSSSPVEIDGRRVALELTLPAGADLHFTAYVNKK